VGLQKPFLAALGEFWEPEPDRAAQQFHPRHPVLRTKSLTRRLDVVCSLYLHHVRPASLVQPSFLLRQQLFPSPSVLQLLVQQLRFVPRQIASSLQ